MQSDKQGCSHFLNKFIKIQNFIKIKETLNLNYLFGHPPCKHGRIWPFTGCNTEARGPDQNETVSSVVHHQGPATVTLSIISLDYHKEQNGTFLLKK
jgi:hypothetical protein